MSRKIIKESFDNTTDTENLHSRYTLSTATMEVNCQLVSYIEYLPIEKEIQEVEVVEDHRLISPVSKRLIFLSA